MAEQVWVVRQTLAYADVFAAHCPYSFSERLHQARQEELSLLLKRTYTTAAQNVFMLGSVMSSYRWIELRFNTEAPF